MDEEIKYTLPHDTSNVLILPASKKGNKEQKSAISSTKKLPVLSKKKEKKLRKILEKKQKKLTVVFFCKFFLLMFHELVFRGLKFLTVSKSTRLVRMNWTSLLP